MVRIKQRYLLVHILYPETPEHVEASKKDVPDVVRFHAPAPKDLTAQMLVRDIKDSIELMFGDYGLGMSGSGFAIKYFSPATSTFIVRCPRAQFRLVWAALTFMTSVPSPQSTSSRQQSSSRHRQPCVLRVVRVSGTIRKAEEELIRRAREDILRAQGNEGGAGVDRVFKGLGLDLGLDNVGDSDAMEA